VAQFSTVDCDARRRIREIVSQRMTDGAALQWGWRTTERDGDSFLCSGVR
jgi:hypothetical protein